MKGKLFYKLHSSLIKLSKVLKNKINPGDIIYLECNLFGLLQNIKNEKPSNIIKKFLDVFLRTIGKKGTLITPSFSYSWGKDKKKKIFDLQNTKSTSGVFSEYLRKKKILRTNDPMFSCLILGNQKKFKFINSNNSFGKKSIYSFLHEKNAHLINFGLNKFDPTFVHYVEQFFHENYSKLHYRKIFELHGSYNSKKYKSIHYSFLRLPKLNYTYDDKKILKKMLKKKDLYSGKILHQKIYICKSKNFFESGIEGLKKNNNFFIKKENHD